MKKIFESPTVRMFVDDNITSTKDGKADSGIDDFYFGKFCKHIPRVLRRQLVAKLVEQYMQSNTVGNCNTLCNTTGEAPAIQRSLPDGLDNPSIVRFHCALLFVDISGFTVLSQKLKVDNLKNQINAYFQKIVDIITKYDGEIIKFAGDALFIIWQTETNNTGDDKFLSAAREAAENAVNCGIEINLECGNYPIALQTKRMARKSKHGIIQLKKDEVVYSSTGNDALAQGILDLNTMSDERAAMDSNNHSVPPVVPTQPATPIKSTSAPFSLSQPASTEAAQGIAIVPPRPASTTGTEAERNSTGTTAVTPKSTTPKVTTPKSTSATHAPAKAASPVVAKATRKRREPTVTYLNVHAGVSMGVMAGMDVGANDRFEYLLLGRPMNDVAIAEGDADTGEIVISPAVHDLLHNYDSFRASNKSPGETPAGSSPRPLTCGCTRTDSGFFKIRNSLDDMLCAVSFGAPSPRKSSKKAPMYVAPTEGEQEGDGDLQYEFEVYAHVIEELMAGYKAISPTMSASFANVVLAAPGVSAVTTDGLSAAAVEYTEKEVMMEHFFSWAQHCLLDDIAKHVHEVVRKGYAFYQDNRAAPFEHFLSSPTCIENFRAELAVSQPSRPHDTSVISPRTSINADGEPTEGKQRSHRSSHGRSSGGSFVSKMRKLSDLSTLREKKHSQHQQVLSKDGALVSELRNVIVLFISVKIRNAAVFLSSADGTKDVGVETPEQVEAVKTCKVDTFHFLSRTVEEIEADKKLINQFQSCMEVMTGVFHDKGGQMRQFIVDDKGTVCIGTFGLKGSVNYDNGACAIDAADLIIARLQELGFDASVGVTSGAAYCGLVGSNTRHEYAVMGPSTNLSARLMGRAQEGEIICDSAIRQRDRAHTYTSLGAVKAKGYTNLVPIFKPQFGIDENGLSLQFRSPSRQSSSSKGVLSKQTSRLVQRDALDSMTLVFGRKAEVQAVFHFLLQDTVRGEPHDLWHALWELHGLETAEQLEQCSITIQPFAPPANVHDSLLSKERRCRFDISKSSKVAVIVAPTGMGKTALLDLLHLKLNRLAVKSKAYYNIAVFRHQAGNVNATTVLSAWYSQFRQLLRSIAETVAEGGDPQAVLCLEAIQKDDCTPIVDFLCNYLPVELRPFTPLLSLVGIKLAAPNKSRVTSTTATVSSYLATAENDDTVTNNIIGLPKELQAAVESHLLSGAAISTDSYKGDTLAALDPADKLLRCAELIVSIIQLHVKITRKLTFFLMDDLQQHDPASQELGRMIHVGTTGVYLLGTYRNSGGESGVNQEQSDSQRAHPNMAALSYHATMVHMPLTDTFLRVGLPALSATATKKLFANVFTECGIQQVNDATFHKLQTLSGGNPSYATEMAKGICDRYIHRDTTQLASHQNADTAADLAAIIDDFRTDRIEEIVHFRFDKLSEQCQLVLKMAAVASVSGAHFTLAMLTNILDATKSLSQEETSSKSEFDAMIFRAVSKMGLLDPETDPEDECGFDQRGMTFSSKGSLSSTIDLVAALNDLLVSEEFIETREVPQSELHTANDDDHHSWLESSSASTKTIPNNTRASFQLPAIAENTRADGNKKQTSAESLASSKSGRDRSALQQLRFHWKVDMELRAIYDLMLDEQKESLHDRVASYLEENLQRSSNLTATDWFQLGFHWERATTWSSAMTCYYKSGMLLRDQGDLLGCKAHFTEAFRMLDKMKRDAGLKKRLAANTHSTATAIVTDDGSTASHSPNSDGITLVAAATTNPELQLHMALGGQQSGLTAADLYKLFEGDAHLLYTGFSLIVRVAQGLIGFGTGALSLQLYEEAIEMMRVLCSSTEPLVASDGLPFELRNKDICFIVLSGMFMLLLSGQAKDDGLHSRIQATVALSIQIARSKPEYQVHLVMALACKLKMLDLFQAANPAIAPGIIFTADELMTLYKPSVHSQELVYYYSSDRVGNAMGVVMKLLCLKGNFAQNLKYLDHAKKIASEMSNFYSLSIGILVLFPILLMYHSDSQAQILYEKYLKTERTQRNNDFRDGAAIWMEWIAQTHKFEKLKTSFDETLFESDSVVVEHIIQAKVFVQAQESSYYMNLLRLHCIGVEFALASICYLKAQRYEVLARHRGDPHLHRDKIRAYLELGLLHLSFSPQQSAMNQMFLFSNLHEKLLRAKLLMKSVEYCDVSAITGNGDGASPANTTTGQTSISSTQLRAQLWQQALENLQYCAAVGKRGDFHTVLLHAGMNLQTLSALPVLQAGPATAGDSVGGDKDILTPADVANDSAEVTADQGATAAVAAQATALAAAQMAQADLQLRATLHAQGVALQAQALQNLRQVNGDEIYTELIHKKWKINV